MALGLRRPVPQASLSDVTLLAGGLAVASLIELAILRTFTRTAVHIPDIEPLERPYEFIARGGEYAYFVSVALLVPALAVIAWQLLVGNSPIRWPAVLGIGMFALAGGLAAVDAIGRLALDAATVSAVVLLAAAVAASRRDLRLAAPAACFAVASLLNGLYTFGSSSAADGTVLQSARLLDGAELFGVAFAFTTPLMARGTSARAAKWAALAIGGSALLVFLGNGSTSRFLLLWNVGLSGILPGVVYAAAAGALAWAIVSLLRSGERLAAVGLLLLVTGGIGLHNTYQSGLIVTGLAALALGLSTTRASREP